MPLTHHHKFSRTVKPTNLNCGPYVPLEHYYFLYYYYKHALMLRSSTPPPHLKRNLFQRQNTIRREEFHFHFQSKLYERKAEAFLQLCDFQSAAMHLRKVYHMSPKEGIRERLAFIVFLQVGLGIFLERLNRGTLSNSFSPSIACLAAMNRFNDCLQMVNAEVELDKSNADLFVLRARLFEYFGKASCCFCNLQEALALDPDHTEAQVLLRKMTKEAERSKDCAVTLAIKGNLKGALLKINRAINYNPLDEKYFLFRGTLLRRLKDFSAAIDDYLRAVELCRADEASEVRHEAEKQVLLSYNDFAVHCYFKGCYEEAVLLLNKAIKGEKNEFGLYINRGDCFLKLGQLNFAMADYQQALELHPLDPRLPLGGSQLYSSPSLCFFRHGPYLQAETRFSCAVDNDPWEVKYYLNRAKTRVFLQEFLGAKEDMISALLLNPNKEEVRTLMGNLFPGESKESLLNSKVGDLTKTLLDRKLKSFPGGKALQRYRIEAAGRFNSIFLGGFPFFLSHSFSPLSYSLISHSFCPLFSLSPYSLSPLILSPFFFPLSLPSLILSSLVLALVLSLSLPSYSLSSLILSSLLFSLSFCPLLFSPLFFLSLIFSSPLSFGVSSLSFSCSLSPLLFFPVSLSFSFSLSLSAFLPSPRPLKSTGSELPTNMYIQIEDQKGEEKEEGSEEKKLQKRLAECQQNSHQVSPPLGRKTRYFISLLIKKLCRPSPP
uniref:Tetratricopeptide repeat domain 16 n=1 Tax=Pseudonaja textilis TaxID=8673 RepID=A0A670YCY5_PSETE